jgi:serine/threonine protein kinase
MASLTFSGLDPFRLSGIALTKNELGTGSYATVYELDYYGLKCAGKKIHDSLVKQQAGRGDTYQLSRFAEECRLLSQARHPNVVQFLGVYYEQGMKVPILVMEFLPINLTSCIDKNGVLRPELSYSILYDVALGLNYLHSQEPPIIHRDLSSNNVLLTSDMKAKISDLGVAKIVNLTPLQVSRMVHNTQAPGTPAYMPPEALVANPKYDRSIDVFSFGIMIIHMFSGKWPEPQIAQIRLEYESDRMIPVSEAERRKVFLTAIGDKHPMMSLIRQCIANNSKKRPNANEIVAQLKAMVAKNSPSFSNRLEMLQHIDRRKSNEERLQSQNKTLRQELKAATAKKQGGILLYIICNQWRVYRGA